MAFKLKSDVRETSTSGGTGNQVLAGALDGSYRTFASEYADGDTFFYCMKLGSAREIGKGTYNAVANSITRTKVYKSTNSNGLVSFPVGTVDIFVTNIAPDDLDTDGLQLLRAALGFSGQIGKNKLINGSFSDDQRNNGAAQTFSAGAALAYCVDRFYAGCNGANVTGQRIAGTGAYRYSYRFTGAASNTATFFGQRIEAAECVNLANKDVVCQIELSSSSVTSVTWAAYYASAADDFSSPSLITAGTITVNSTPTDYAFTFNAGANAGKGILIQFNTGALLSGQTLTYGGDAQLELGTKPSPFEVLHPATNTMNCERFREVTVVRWDSYSAGTGSVTFPVRFRVKKRTSSPAVSYGSITAVGSMDNSAPTNGGLDADRVNPSKNGTGAGAFIFIFTMTVDNEL